MYPAAKSIQPELAVGYPSVMAQMSRPSSSVFISPSASKTCNNKEINFKKAGNQKGNCQAYWPPIAQAD